MAGNLRDRLFIIVFGTETKAGKQFDLILLWLILLSVLAVMLESVPSIGNNFPEVFYYLEWFFTFVFTLEYLLRLWISPKPFFYISSFWGIIDLLAILPTYLGLFIPGYQYLRIVRIFRLLRVFRILKLVRFNSEAQILISALRSSSYKISIFLIAVLAIVTLLGTTMYVFEGPENGYTSIPESIYWAIVTVTTVGYGDLVPHTVIGKMLSSLAMITGYAIIAVPTGIVTAEFAKVKEDSNDCILCSHNNPSSAKFCSNCGAGLEKESNN